MAKNSKPKVFSKKFEGVFSDQKICQGCPHRYEREQAFMALNLTVKSNNLQESLDQFVKGELLDGDNAYFCEKCQEKRDTIKRMCIRKLPQTLVIQLKRFHYDWETNRAVKFDDYFQFPWTLDMGPYTSEGIKRAEMDDQDDGKPARKLSFSKSLENAELSHPYELVGVVVHSGQANAGHYYSYIKERRGNLVTNRNKNKWFKFNDTTVEEFEMTDEALTAECFGGTYKVKKTANSNLPEDRQRYWNAYMLFYEASPDKDRRSLKKSASISAGRNRQSGSAGSSTLLLSAPRKISTPSGGIGAQPRVSEPPAARESLSQLSDLLEKGDKTGLFTNRMPSTIEREIHEENLRFLQNRDVFCDDYYRFVFELASVNSRKNGLSFRKPTNSDVAAKTSLMHQESVRLSVHFLLNSYLHVKKKTKSGDERYTR